MPRSADRMDEIKAILGENYTGRGTGAIICLADEETHHVMYSGDNYELGGMLAYAVALFARDDSDDDLTGFLSHFITAVHDAYRHETDRRNREVAK